MVQQKLHRFSIILQGHDIQGGSAVGVHIVNIGGIVQKETSNVKASLQKGDTERGAALQSSYKGHMPLFYL